MTACTPCKHDGMLMLQENSQLLKHGSGMGTQLNGHRVRACFAPGKSTVIADLSVEGQPLLPSEPNRTEVSKQSFKCHSLGKISLIVLSCPDQPMSPSHMSVPACIAQAAQTHSAMRHYLACMCG